MTSSRSIEADLARTRVILEQNTSLDSRSEQRKWKDASSKIERIEKRMFVGQKIADFTVQSAALDWGSPEAYLVSLRTLWWHLMEDVYCNYEMPDDLITCTADCMHDHEIICLNAELSLYGCCAHGAMHHCVPLQGYDEDGTFVIIPPKCSCRIRTKQDDSVCMFSGRVAVKEIANVRTSSSDFQSSSSSTRGIANFAYRVAMRGGSGNAFENHDRKKAVAEAKKAMPPPPPKSSSTSTFVPDDYRSSKVRDEVHEDRRTYMRGVAEAVVNRVLYNREVRDTINLYSEEKIVEKSESDLYAYHATNASDEQLPSWIECLAVFWTAMADFKLLPYVEPDHHERRRFGKLTMKLWELCHRSPFAKKAMPNERSPTSDRQSFCTLKQFALAVLYAMRNGMPIKCGAKGNMRNSFYGETVQIIPFAAHLHAELPHKRDLKLFSDSEQERIKAVNAGYSSTSGAKEHAGRATDQRAKRKRKRQGNRRNRRVEVGVNKVVSEASMLPEHWKNRYMGDDQEFSGRDANRGRKFLTMCLESYDIEFLQTAAATLDAM